MSKDRINSLHTYIYFSTRVVYNMEAIEGYHDNVIKLQGRENCFRKEKDKLHGQGDRTITVNCTDIADAIVAKRIVDTAILSEIKFIGNNSICNHSYTNSFKFPMFTSNPEVHSFSKKGKHTAIIKSLGAYSEMDFRCWNYVSNDDIKSIFINKFHLLKYTNEISSAMSQISGLFICEASRNSSSLITLPMCLEIYDDFCRNDQNRVMILDLDHNYYYKNLQDKRINSQNLLTKVKEKLQSKDISEENIAKDVQLLKYSKDIEQIDKEILILQNSLPNLEELDMILVLKFIINNYFPMGMKGAVEASRETNVSINKLLSKPLNQSYDNQEEGSKLFQKILNNLEISLITLWSKIKGFVQKEDMEGLELKHIHNASQIACEKIFYEWYNIEFDENDWKELTMEVVGKIEDVLSIDQ